MHGSEVYKYFFYCMYVHCLNTRLERLARFIMLMVFLFIQYFTAQQPVIALLFSLLKLLCCYRPINNLLYSQCCYTPYFYICWIDIYCPKSAELIIESLFDRKQPDSRGYNRATVLCKILTHINFLSNGLVTWQRHPMNKHNK